MDACADGNMDKVYRLVCAKVNLNCRIPYYGTTPLSVAFRNGHKPVCNLLIQFGAKFDPDNYEAQKYDTEMHKRQEEEERLAAKKTREGTPGGEKKKKGAATSNGKGKKVIGTAKPKPGTPSKPAAATATGTSEVIGSRKVAVPVAAVKTVKKSMDSLKKSDGALKKSDNTLNMGSFPKLPQKTRASNAWTAT
ncbi:UNVERIFIED_CONTAM: hypothetical protein HDU68_008309 [Siphonaria sp. JEL0065]|nr:hypothetical protein HDU68_008309 [Siphonaria sp. JEL0065]